MKDKRKNLKIFVAAVLIVSFTGCASYNQERYDKSLSTVKRRMQECSKNEEHPKAMKLALAVLEAEPENKKAEEIKQKALEANPELAIFLDKKWLGSNLSDRIPKENVGILKQILFYCPNRILDFLDIFTVEVGGGAGIGLKVQATGWVEAGAKASAGEIMLGIDRRHLSAVSRMNDYLIIGPEGVEFLMEAGASTNWFFARLEPSAGFKMPTDKKYQKARDFWAIGFEKQVFPFSLRCEFHPVEIADFFSGWIGVDFINDDLGTSKGFSLNREDSKAVQELIEQTGLRKRE